MNKKSLFFKSNILEALYQSRRADHILEIFKLSFAVLIILLVISAIVGGVSEQSVRSLYVIIGVIGTIFCGLIYYFVTTKKQQQAKYYLGLLCLLLNIFQLPLFISDKPLLAELSGQAKILIQIGLVAQTGYLNSMIFIGISFIIKLSIFFIYDEDLVLPIVLFAAMLYFIYFTYVNEKASRILFLQTLQEDTMFEKLLPGITDKQLILLRFDDKCLSFKIKYQNIFKEDPNQNSEKQVKGYMRDIFVNKEQSLELYLFQLYKKIQADPKLSQDYLFQECIKLSLTKSNTSFQSVSINAMNGKDLTFIITFEKYDTILATQKLIKPFLKTLEKNKNMMIKVFKQKILWDQQPTNVLCVKNQGEIKLELLKTILKNVNMHLVLNKQISCQVFQRINLFQTLENIKQQFLFENCVRINILQPIDMSSNIIISDLGRIQLLLLNLIVFSVRKYSATIIQLSLISKQDFQSTTFPTTHIFFTMKTNRHQVKDVPNIIKRLYENLGPNNQFKLVKARGQGQKLLKKIILVSFQLGFYNNLERFQEYLKE